MNLFAKHIYYLEPLLIFNSSQILKDISMYTINRFQLPVKNENLVCQRDDVHVCRSYKSSLRNYTDRAVTCHYMELVNAKMGFLLFLFILIGLSQY